MNRRHPTDPARLLVIGLALIAAGCSDSGLGPNQGRVRFVLSSGGTALATAAAESPAVTPTPGTTGATASPSLTGDGEGEHHDYRAFQTANVTFSSILARDQAGVLVNVAMDLPVQVDIVAMDTGGNQVALPEGNLPAGTYDQLVVVMTQLDGVLKDGTQLSITPPGGGWTAIVPMCSFTVAEGATEPVQLQFMVRQAFSWQNLRYHFQPQLRCVTSDGSTGG